MNIQHDDKSKLRHSSQRTMVDHSFSETKLGAKIMCLVGKHHDIPVTIVSLRIESFTVYSNCFFQSVYNIDTAIWYVINVEQCQTSQHACDEHIHMSHTLIHNYIYI